MVHTIAKRLKAVQQNVTKRLQGDTKASQALALIEQQDIELQKWVEENLKFTKNKVKHKIRQDSYAFDEGRRAGRLVDIDSKKKRITA